MFSPGEDFFVKLLPLEIYISFDCTIFLKGAFVEKIFFVFLVKGMFGWYGTCIYVFLIFILRHKHPVIKLSIFCIFVRVISLSL